MPKLTARIDVRMTHELVADLHVVRKTLGRRNISDAARHALMIGIATVLNRKASIRRQEIERISLDLQRIAGMLSAHMAGDESAPDLLSRLNTILSQLEAAPP